MWLLEPSKIVSEFTTDRNFNQKTLITLNPGLKMLTFSWNIENLHRSQTIIVREPLDQSTNSCLWTILKLLPNECEHIHCYIIPWKQWHRPNRDHSVKSYLTFIEQFQLALMLWKISMPKAINKSVSFHLPVTVYQALHIIVQHQFFCVCVFFHVSSK